MADGDLVKTIVEAIIDGAAKHGIPAALGFVAGGTAAFAKWLPKNPVNNFDFRITREQTDVSIDPDPASATHARVRVKRDFSLKLRDDKKKGRYEINLDLNQTHGKWDKDCRITLDDEHLGIKRENEDSIIRAKTPKLTRSRKLDVVLSSSERISKARRFYALVISNPKDDTTFQWSIDPAATGIESARAYASSEDFDLILLAPGKAHPIHQSAQQVTYFITW